MLENQEQYLAQGLWICRLCGHEAPHRFDMRDHLVKAHGIPEKEQLQHAYGIKKVRKDIL